MNPPVILLHGLWQTRLTMAKINRRLRSRGLQTTNIGYPSYRADIRSLAAGIWDRISGRFGQPVGCFDFVTMSMGGVVLRQLAADHPGLVRRAVMIAPPNRGSEWVSVAQRVRLVGRLIGPAGLEMGCDPDSAPNRLGPPDFEVGVIAGSKPDNPFSRFVTPGPEDGRVSVARTGLDGMTGQVVLPYGHLLLTYRGEVIEQAAFFLENGFFLPGKD